MRLYLKIRSSFLFLLFGFFIFDSCIREEIIDDETLLALYKEKLVVYCLLTPGDSIYAYIARTAPFSKIADKPEDYYVFNALVELSDNNNFTTLILKSDTFPLYVASQDNFKVIPSTQYHLNVSTPGGLNAHASTITPLTFSKLNQENVSQYTIYDIEFEEYQLIVEVLLNWETIVDYNYGYYLFSSSSNSINHGLAILDYYYSAGNMNFCRYGYNMSFRNNEVIHDTLYLATTDESLANFIRSQEIFEQIKNVLDGGSFLNLFRGIIPETSNIEEGVGIFGSYLSDTVIIEINTDEL